MFQMTHLDPKREKPVAVVLSILLLSVVGMTLENIAKYGIAFLDAFPRTSPAEQLFGLAAFLLLIGGADFADVLKRAQSIRVQIQCWAAWLFLLASMFAARSLSLFSQLVLPFAIAICGLALYSLVAIYCPRDLLGKPMTKG